MNRLALIALLSAVAPASAFALPAVGDIIGTNPTDATKALNEAGCPVSKFEAEGNKIEAKCRDADGNRWEIYLDPASGAVTQIKQDH